MLKAGLVAPAAGAGEEEGVPVGEVTLAGRVPKALGAAPLFIKEGGAAGEEERIEEGS